MKLPMLPWQVSAADRRLLPEGRVAGPMPWVIAIMMFLTVLAAAGGLGLRSASGTLGQSLSNRVTVQIIQADADERERQAKAVSAALSAMPGVERQERVPDSDMAKLLEPWIGVMDAREALPIPILIDVDLSTGTAEQISALKTALTKIAPAARVDDHGAFLKPLASLFSSLTLLSASLVVLMGSATAFAVVLAARSALDMHRSTIDVMHLLGATDAHIAQLFQRRIALDALFGGLVGLAAAALVIVGLGGQIGRLGSELIGTVALPNFAWFLLCLLPIAGVALATLTARMTILRALERTL